MKKEVVMPGAHLTTEEEYSAANNTFTQDGEVYSEAIGVAEFNKDERTVRVNASKEIVPLKTGDIVLARVLFKRKSMAAVEILEVESDKGKRIISPLKKAAIMIKDISNDYVEDIEREFMIGDIVRAKVTLASKSGVNLKTNEEGLGVIKKTHVNYRENLAKFPPRKQFRPRNNIPRNGFRSKRNNY